MSTTSTASSDHPAPHAADDQNLATLSLAALGVVFGDIGTSPIYAFREALHAAHGVHLVRDDVLGLLSLIFWSLIVIVSIKYLLFVLRADNHGEGGILAMTTLVNRHMPKHRRLLGFLMILGPFGTALLYGDGILTPSISVLSAVEGLNVATPVFEPYVLPITVAILILLFLFQYKGTEKVGRFFGPIVGVWFITLAALGVYHIWKGGLEIFAALSPHYGIEFLLYHKYIGFIVLGSVFLAVTGGEALYADLGHFGARPIRLVWFSLVMPALVLNYMGQGALVLHHPEAMKNPFFNMVPDWAIYPMVLLTTLATVIASQALITGTFSLTMQAIQLKYLPRMRVDHTSETAKGQIYLPVVNWTLMVMCVIVVMTFQTSSRLAAAYGVGVTLDMVITSTLFYFMLRHGFKWPRWKAVLLCGFFLTIELTFFAGNAVKIPHGGWFPLAVGIFMYILMSTWRIGRMRLRSIQSERAVRMDQLIQKLRTSKPLQVPGTAVFMHREPSEVPPALVHNLQHNHVLHKRNLLVTVIVEDYPYAPQQGVVEAEDLGESFYRVKMTFGYMDKPDVPNTLRRVKLEGEELDPMECSYFLGRETILPRRWLWSGMSFWREKIFILLSRNAQDATAFYMIPPSLVMEVGSQIEI